MLQPNVEQVQGTRNNYPPVSEHKVEPESGKEHFRGETRACLPANPPHSEQQSTVVGVLRACRQSAYTVDIDLLTRQDRHNNFASDVCLRKRGMNPATGDRYLEEVAFEIKATQSFSDLKERARLMAKRGVKTWDQNERLHDVCLAQPLRVKALLDAIEAEEVIFQAMLASDHPVVVEHNAEVYLRGMRKSLSLMLRVRGFAVSDKIHRRIEACSDESMLARWVERAMSAGDIGETFDDA